MTTDLPTTLVGHGQELEIEWTSVDIGSYFDLEMPPGQYDYRFVVRHIGGVKCGPIHAGGNVPENLWWYYHDLNAALEMFGWSVLKGGDHDGE